jgi:hypothetical protein
MYVACITAGMGREMPRAMTGLDAGEVHIRGRVL